ncbi:MAG TPA: PAS domain-containing sensor histidine kinase [Firmicutes bacterium]|nr:PAS domain-containing sensor histidine kinase [Candidatus Fermentithermobacillaceae bacterium]
MLPKLSENSTADECLTQLRLHAIVAGQSPLPMAVFFPPKYRCAMANPAFEELFKSDYPVVGKGLYDILPETAAEAIPLFEEVLRFGLSRTIDDVARTAMTPGGLKMRHYMVILSRVQRETDYGVLLTIIDTTERVLAAKQTQHALDRAEQSSAAWQAIFEAASQGLAVVDENLNIVAMNRAAAEILGVLEDEVGQKLEPRLGRSVLHHPTTGEPLKRSDYPATRAAKGKYVLNFPATLHNRAGRAIDVLISTAPVNSPPGYPRRFVITWQDVTNLRALERAKNNFMMVISHELRNPLQVILGLMKLVPKDPGQAYPSEMSNYLDILENQVRHLNSLVNEILQGYQLDSGRLPINLEPVNLADVLRQAMAPYLIRGTRTWVGPEPDAEEILVMGDVLRLSQLIGNLLSNAVKYSPEGTIIEVKLSTDGSNAFLKVLDQGRGIPAGELERVFEGFYRPANVADWVSGSIGLGLYISRATARAHGGDLWAENRDGGGTVMCLRLPLLAE